MNEKIGVITKCYRVEYERSSKHSVARMWQAITEPEELARWMGAKSRVDLRPGGEYVVEFRDADDGALEGIIVRVEPERRLGYVWGWSYVEWELDDDGYGGCRYTFLQNGLADRGADEEGLPAGWHGFFEELDDHLEGVYRDKEVLNARWDELKPPYREQLDRVLRR